MQPGEKDQQVRSAWDLLQNMVDCVDQTYFVAPSNLAGMKKPPPLHALIVTNQDDVGKMEESVNHHGVGCDLTNRRAIHRRQKTTSW